MNSYLVISALGNDRPGIVKQVSKTILDQGGNINESRMTVLGGEFALMLLVNGDSENLQLLQQQLPQLATQLGLTIVTQGTSLRQSAQTQLPYIAHIVAMDHPGIVHEVTDFFADRGINIEVLNTDTYPAPHTGAPMFALELTISIPKEHAISQLKEQFNEFCNSLNLDATLRADKPQ